MARMTVRRRSEIPTEDTWKLEDLFASDHEWEMEYDVLLDEIGQMKQYAGKLSSDADILLACFRQSDTLSYHLGRIVVYANERYHQDTANPVYQAYASRADHVSALTAEALSFMEPEILSMPRERLTAFLEENEALSHYRRAIDEILRTRAHTLSEAEERLLAKANEVMEAPGNIFSSFQNADIKFPSIRDMEGNRIPVTAGNFVLLQKHEDRGLRKQVFESLYQTYARWGNTVASIYISQIKADQFRAEVSRYSSARAMYLDRANIPEAVYDNLIEVVHRHLPAMYRYVALRKRLLEADALHMYDVYVPIVENVRCTYTFEEAKDIVLKALAPMGEEYISILRKGFEERWIDVYENEGKRQGAYSWGAYGTHPYVLLNFQGDLDSVFTLAHEMGHAIHTYYSNQAQSITYSDYRIFVAEVASTCNEALLTHYLLEHTEDEKLKLYLINHYLESFRGTLYRQAMFAEFEQKAHQAGAEGTELTMEWLNRTYYELVKLYFGPDMVADEEIAYEWMRIPHFYKPFYVYQYATGYSAAIAFSNRILHEGAKAVETYTEHFLKGGCSKDPIDLLADAGVDMSTPRAIEDALGVFEEYLGLFESHFA